MARKTKIDAAFDTLRARRATEDGRACVDVAQRLYDQGKGNVTKGEKPDVEVIAESRKWVALGLAHDKATDSALLQELRDRLDEKKKRSAELAEMRATKQPAELKVVTGGAS
jgi:hypothetical protein